MNMAIVTQIIRNDGRMDSPTVQDMADLLAKQTIEIVKHGRILPQDDNAVSRGYIAQARAVAKQQFGFDMRGTSNWLERKPASTTRIDTEILGLLING
jgi:hypothetical protein